MPPLRNIRMTLAYDGTDFHGWQAQPGLRTVQGVVNEAVRRICRHPLTVHGAGRTDAGVHALGQTANFETDSDIPPAKLFLAIGHRLPPDVALVELSEAPPDFHASRSAAAKLYRYRIHNHASRPVETLSQRYAAHVWHALDVERMRAAAAAWIGRHDFAGLASAGNPRPDTNRTVFSIEVAPRDREVVVEVAGDGFLYNQVRNMVGTLIEIGRGHWPVERAAEIIAARDRRLAGPTAPALGLTLCRVRY